MLRDTFSDRRRLLFGALSEKNKEHAYGSVEP
jgi:hypothetical protein